MADRGWRLTDPNAPYNVRCGAAHFVVTTVRSMDELPSGGRTAARRNLPNYPGYIITCRSRRQGACASEARTTEISLRRRPAQVLQTARPRAPALRSPSLAPSPLRLCPNCIGRGVGLCISDPRLWFRLTPRGGALRRLAFRTYTEALAAWARRQSLGRTCVDGTAILDERGRAQGSPLHSYCRQADTRP